MQDNKATDFVTITLAEYTALTKAKAALEVLVYDTSYCSSDAVNAVREAARRLLEGGGGE